MCAGAPQPIPFAPWRTRAVHAGRHPGPTTGAIATPISQTTAFGYGTLERGAAIFAGEAPGYRYSRFANPTVAALEAKMADLEGAAAAVAFASGTAASSSVLLGLLNPGDELVFLGPLYGGTEGLLRSLGERWGITVVDATTRGLQACLTPATRMVWVETLTNPTLRLHDLAQVAAVARAHGAITVADNTFCTPCLLRPLACGIDLVLHSMTKYLGGHGDATGGLVAGSEALVGAVRKTGLGHVGGNLSPQEAFCFCAVSRRCHCAWPPTAKGRLPWRTIYPRTPPCAPCTTPACQATPSMRWHSASCRAGLAAWCRSSWHAASAPPPSRCSTAWRCSPRPCPWAMWTAWPATRPAPRTALSRPRPGPPMA